MDEFIKVIEETVLTDSNGSYLLKFPCIRIFKIKEIFTGQFLNLDENLYSNTEYEIQYEADVGEYDKIEVVTNTSLKMSDLVKRLKK